MTPEIRQRLQDIGGYAFDIDGTLVQSGAASSGYQALPGAREILQLLDARQIPFLVFSNDSTRTPQQLAQALAQAGLNVGPERTLTPASVAAALFRRKKHRRILLLGAKGVEQPLTDAGFEVTLSPQRAAHTDAVLLNWYPDFTLADLEAASCAVWAGAKLYTVSVASYVDGREGRVLGIPGALAAALRNITSRRATIVGKPWVDALRVIGERLGIRLSQVAFVGSDPALENAMAHKSKALSITVHTGMYGADDFEQLPRQLRPHLSLPDVDRLLRLISDPEEPPDAPQA
ncbi:MAG: HAD hydrolase-like protein [Burkholderiaceae bacterium]|jgi:NagD protein|nr:HAD hydrolase-like protein [Burkholderiaceae bacterium]